MSSPKTSATCSQARSAVNTLAFNRQASDKQSRSAKHSSALRIKLRILPACSASRTGISTAVAKGFTPDDPLLRTGQLRDSISHQVQGLDAVVGSTSEVMVY